MRWFLACTAIACAVAAALWIRAALYRRKFLRAVDNGVTDPEARMLATAALSRDITSAGVYIVLAGVALVAAITRRVESVYLIGLLAVPVAATVRLSRYSRRDALLSLQRFHLERRASEVLSQEESAPKRWAERLAPSVLPDLDGYDLGTAHQAGVGVMSGDLLDVFRLPSGRLCCVVGDVMGHDVEASISALQTKFLLRSYLRRFRDPGQALEELNAQLIDLERPEEFVSLFVAVFDDRTGTCRYASAGHPPGWVCRDRQPSALNATGPLLMLDPSSTYSSAEFEFRRNDVVLISTDGLTEARDGDRLFGEEQVAALLRRESEVSGQVLCKTMIDAAVEFSGGTLGDDITVLAIRKVS